jgi:SPP1 gp7 family putative phage head morphogenesis protein
MAVRDTMRVLHDYLERKQTKVARLVHNTWNSNAESLTFEDLFELQRGGFPTSALTRWQQRYRKVLAEDLAQEWQEGIASAHKATVKATVIPSIARVMETLPITAIAARFVDARRQLLEAAWSRRDLVNLAAAVTELTRTGLLEGLHPNELAKRIRPLVGLTQRHAKQLARLDQSLAAANTPKEKRERILNSTAARMIRQRAQTIAQTELATAFNYGVLQSFAEAVAQTGIQAVKVYRTARDELVCPICAPMDGQRVDVNDTFPAALPDSDFTRFPPLHINCRCTINFEVV